MDRREGDDAGIGFGVEEGTRHRAEIGVDDLIAVTDDQRLVVVDMVDGHEGGADGAHRRIAELNDDAIGAGDQLEDRIETVLDRILPQHDEDEASEGIALADAADDQRDHRRAVHLDQRLGEMELVLGEEIAAGGDGDQVSHQWAASIAAISLRIRS